MESRNAYYTVASNNIYTHHQCSSVLLSVGHILSCENGISDTTISRITFNLSFSLLVLSVYRQLPFPYSFRPSWDWLYEGAEDKTIYQGWWWRWRWNGTLMMIIMLLASGMHCFSFPPDIPSRSFQVTEWLQSWSSATADPFTPPNLPLGSYRVVIIFLVAILASSIPRALWYSSSQSLGVNHVEWRRPLFLPVHCSLSLVLPLLVVAECLALQLCLWIPIRLHNNIQLLVILKRRRRRFCWGKPNTLGPPPVTMMTTMAAGCIWMDLMGVQI